MYDSHATSGTFSATVTQYGGARQALDGTGALDAGFGPSQIVTAATTKYPAAAALVDDFTTLNSAKWTFAPNASLNTGRLQLSTTATYQGAASVALYDLTSSAACVEMVQTAGPGNGTVDTSFYMRIDANRGVVFTRENTALFFQYFVGGTFSNATTSIPYSATTHRWLRFAHDGTSVLWQTSPDGITWTTRATWAPTFAVTGLQAYLETGYYGTEPSPGVALFDNFNNPPATASVTWQSEVTPNELQLGWILNSGTNVRAVAATDSAFTTKIYGNTITRPVSGWCTSRVTGLTADTLYYTGVEVDGVLLTTGQGQYRTLRTDLVAAKVITSSCYANPGNQPVFAQISSENPAFFVQQGDIHYWDAATDADWRSGFSQAITSAAFAPMLTTVPMAYFWNNHDWGGDSSNIASPVAAFAPSAVRELSGTTPYPDSNGLWRTWVHGGVRYIVMDPYSYRSPYTDPDTSAKSMLGATQKAWLLNLFQTATEQAIIVFSGFAHPSTPAGTGRWANYPDERTEIGNAIAALTTAQRSKIVFVGGDTHTISADDGVNAMWGRPSLNVSPMQGTGNAPTSGAWDITNQASDSPAHGYYSRLNFTVSGSTLNLTWDAVRDDGVSMATWSTSFAGSSTAANVTGVLATAAAIAPAGSVTGTSTVAGAVAGVAATAPAGSVSGSAAVAGVVAVATASSPAGTVSATKTATLAGPVATGAATAPAGTVAGGAAVAGAVSTAAASAAVGAVSGSAQVSGPVAPATATSPAGSVTATKTVTLAGPVATATVVAPAGGLAVGGSVSVSGQVATATAAAPTGAVIATRTVALSGPTAAATAAAFPGTVAVTSSATVAGLVATATAQALAGLVAVAGSVTVTGPLAAANAAAPAGVVIASAGPPPSAAATETLTVGPENRTASIGAETRVVTVGTETRLTVIT